MTREPRRTLISTLIARGYQPERGRALNASYLVRAGEQWVWMEASEANGALGHALDGGVAVLCPTYVERFSRGEYEEVTARVLLRIAEIEAQLPSLPVILLVGMQHGPGGAEEACRRLEATAKTMQMEHTRFVGIRLSGHGKVRTHNAALQLTRGLGIRCMVWVDDDILMQSGCLAALVRRFFQMGKGAVGAVKIPRSGQHWSASLLFKVKRVTYQSVSYPHACCAAVDMALLENGIPERYASDDGFICFELLSPEASDPLENLQLVPEARCVHVVGGNTSRATLGRIRRMLLNHHVLLADYPSKAAYYLRTMLFHGLWPLSPWDREQPCAVAAAKWCFKAIYFTWFCWLGGELIVRGLIGRPLRSIGWS